MNDMLAKHESGARVLAPEVLERVTTQLESSKEILKTLDKEPSEEEKADMSKQYADVVGRMQKHIDRRNTAGEGEEL